MERTCSLCSNTFTLTPAHVGFSNVCPDCSSGDVPRVLGKVAWSGKHTMELEITSNRREAKAFNDAQRRMGAGVTRSLLQPREEHDPEANYSKTGSGAEPGAIYSTRLGEKRSVKR